MPSTDCTSGGIASGFGDHGSPCLADRGFDRMGLRTQRWAGDSGRLARFDRVHDQAGWAGDDGRTASLFGTGDDAGQACADRGTPRDRADASAYATTRRRSGVGRDDHRGRTVLAICSDLTLEVACYRPERRPHHQRQLQAAARGVPGTACRPSGAGTRLQNPARSVPDGEVARQQRGPNGDTRIRGIESISVQETLQWLF